MTSIRPGAVDAQGDALPPPKPTGIMGPLEHLLGSFWGKLLPLVIGAGVMYGGLRADLLGLQSERGGLPGRVYQLERDVERLERQQRENTLEIVGRLRAIDDKLAQRDTTAADTAAMKKMLEDFVRNVYGRLPGEARR